MEMKTAIILTFLSSVLYLNPILAASGSASDSSSEEEVGPPYESAEVKGIIGSESEAAQAAHVLAAAPAGNFIGLEETTRDGQLYHTFKGIPYVEVPARFQAAVLKAPMDGTYNATFDRNICPQKDGGVLYGAEDCLYLTVSTPHPDRCKDEDSSEGLPVMFWIHSGSFVYGAGAFHGPKYLLDRCVVLVTINYRLGALGFLSTGDDIIPGNLGMKDQVRALEWTQANIRSFRGNPNSVTIFGSSSGSTCVSHHLCSPASAGMFHRAISMSGVVLNPWSVVENPAYYAFALGTILGCTVTGSDTLLACLMEKTEEEILDAQLAITAPGIVFAPVIEPSFANDPFQTRNPFALLKSGDFNRVPYLTGLVESEGVYFAEPVLMNSDLLTVLDKYWLNVAPIYLFYNQLGIPTEEEHRISDSIRTRYFGDFPINASQRVPVINLISDRLFVHGIYETVEVLACSGVQDTFLYVNTYKGGISMAHIYYGYDTPVITHSDDEQYIFPKFQEWTEGPNYQFSLDLVELWTNFALTGVPSGRATRGVTWDKVKQGLPYEKLFHLDTTYDYVQNYLKDRTEYWRVLGLDKYENSV